MKSLIKQFFAGCRRRSFHFIVVLFLAGLSVTGGAQVPGYLGKRAVAGYGFNCSPSFKGANPNDRFLNIIHEFYLDYATKTRTTFGPSIRLYHTLYDNSQYVSNSTVQPTHFYTIKGITVALNFKFYKKFYVAPWGSYFMLSPVLNIARTSYDESMVFMDRGKPIDDFGPEHQTFYHVDLMFGWGRRRILADRIALEYGVNFQVLAQVAAAAKYAFSIEETITAENYIEATHGERVRDINLFNAFIKLGYLF